MSKLGRLKDKIKLLIDHLNDRKFLAGDVQAPTHVGHGQWQQFLSHHFNKPGMKILEVGSREVTGASPAQLLFSQADYVGFDLYEGPNVDVIGDAHKLSSYFKSGDQFDLIYSSACFEHFAMPWLVAEEITKMLKVGGHVFVETHFSYSSHERPWNFFQFSDMALKALFSPALGYECVDSGMSNPMTGGFSSHAEQYLRYKRVTGLYCHSEYLGRKMREVDNFDWKQLNTAEVVEGTTYPQPH